MKKLPGKFFLSPMAEISTPALRQTVKDFSDDVVLFSEMLSAGAIVSGASHNEPLVKKYDFDDPFIYQLVGSRPHIMAEACNILSEGGCCSVDINMGCPNHEIVKKGQGAMLLTDLDKAREIISACRKTSRSMLSVKMRTGYESNDENKFIEFIKMLEGEGVDFITVHPRYSKLNFKRTADWNLVRLAKESIDIPVIGNGDILSPEIFINKKNDSGCDGVMIGREAVKSPWIFRLCSDLFEERDRILKVNIHNTFIITLDRIKSYLPVNLHKSRGHRFCFYFSKNAKFSHELFKSIRKADDIEDMKDSVNDYYHRNPREAEKQFKVEGGRVYETHQIQT